MTERNDNTEVTVTVDNTAHALRAGDVLHWGPVPPPWRRVFRRLWWCWKNKRFRAARYTVTSVQDDTTIEVKHR